jgi:glycosyltransferase 2 family protein
LQSKIPTGADQSDSSEQAVEAKPSGALSDQLARIFGKQGSSHRKRVSTLLRWLIAGLVAIFLAQTLRRAWSDLSTGEHQLHMRNVDWRYVAASVALLMLSLIPASIAWLQTLKTFGQNVPWFFGLHTFFLGHMGKYVPGKAMVFVVRVGRLRKFHVEIKPTILSVFVETLTSLGTGGIIGSILLLTLSPPRWVQACAVICLICALVPLLPPIFRGVIRIAAKSKIGKMPQRIGQSITWTMMSRTCCWMAIGWLLNGMAAWLLLVGVLDASELLTMRVLATCIAAITMAAVSGFFSMLPGGAVVRELTITWLLTSIVSQPDALAFAVLLRLATIIAELAMVAITKVAEVVAHKPNDRDTEALH